MVLVLFAVGVVLSGCGGSGKASSSVPVLTIKQPTRTVTYGIPSSAMEPTILCGKGPPGCTGVANDRVEVQEPAPRVQRGDIIVFRSPGDAAIKCGEGGTFVKRVIGLPGETVREDDHGFIWIRAPRSKTFHKLNETYVTASHRLADSVHFGQVWHTPPDGYFAMGDNRAESCDSRAWGGVLGADLIGKVVKILRPN